MNKQILEGEHAARQECKRRDYKIHLVEEIKKNIRQPNFKAFIVSIVLRDGSRINFRELQNFTKKIYFDKIRQIKGIWKFHMFRISFVYLLYVPYKQNFF